MKIVIGLGNPGPEYKNTRHNIGFKAVDKLVHKWNASGPNKKSKGEIYDASISSEKVILVKPLTFMNLSGSCVGPLIEFYKLDPASVIIIHDDLDLPFASLRVKKGGGTGGHNGLKSLNSFFGPEERGYCRIRVGIGRPENNRIPPAKWVLQQFSNGEAQQLDSILDRVTESVELVLEDKITEAMNKFNVKTT